MMDIFPTFPEDELEAIIKQENCIESSSANVGNSDLIEATAPQYFNPEDLNKTVTFETIPKTETGIVFDDASGVEKYYFSCIDTYSDGCSDSNSEPETDPFADVDCDPSFSQTNKPDRNHTYVSDSSDPSPSSSSTNTLNYKRHQGKKLYNHLQCQLCQETQSSEISLKTHVQICAASHKNRFRFCPLCNALFSYAQGYRKHAFRIHGIDQVEAVGFPLKCEFCSRAFSRKESLNAHKTLCHQETHSNQHDGGSQIQKPFKCQECPSLFATLSQLTQHGQSHSDERPFKCPEPKCGKAFKFSGNLKEHLECVHSEGKPIKCQEPNCGKVFKTNAKLLRHMLTHSETRPFPCSYPDCSKTFKTKDGLTHHLGSHKGARNFAHITERPFKCSECDRAYVKNWQLTSHRKSHSTEIFECPEPNCGVKCKYKQNLEIHISNSHKNKDELIFHLCPEPNCGKKYNHRQSLYIHARDHTGIRPFKCTESGCNDSFIRREYLNYHVKSKHNKKS